MHDKYKPLDTSDDPAEYLDLLEDPESRIEFDEFESDTGIYESIEGELEEIESYGTDDFNDVLDIEDYSDED